MSFSGYIYFQKSSEVDPCYGFQAIPDDLPSLPAPDSVFLVQEGPRLPGPEYVPSTFESVAQGLIEGVGADLEYIDLSSSSRPPDSWDYCCEDMFAKVRVPEGVEVSLYPRSYEDRAQEAVSIFFGGEETEKDDWSISIYYEQNEAQTRSEYFGVVSMNMHVRPYAFTNTDRDLEVTAYLHSYKDLDGLVRVMKEKHPEGYNKVEVYGAYDMESWILSFRYEYNEDDQAVHEMIKQILSTLVVEETL